MREENNNNPLSGIGSLNESAFETTSDEPTSKESSPEAYSLKIGSDQSDGSRSSRASSTSKELARLQFYGPGPKTSSLPINKDEKTRGLKLDYLNSDPVSKLMSKLLASYACEKCDNNDAEK